MYALILFSLLLSSCASLIPTSYKEIDIISQEKQKQLGKILINRDQNDLVTFFNENKKLIRLGERSDFDGIVLSKNNVLVQSGNSLEFYKCLNDTCGSWQRLNNEFSITKSSDCTKEDVVIIGEALASIEYYKNQNRFLCSRSNPSAYLKITKDANGLIMASNVSIEKVMAELPEELRTDLAKQSLDTTFKSIELMNQSTNSSNKELERISNLKEAGIGTFTKSTDPSCSFYHELADKTFSAVHLWLKKLIGINETKAQFAFEIWNDYIQYERERQTGLAVLKKLNKPDLVVVHISPLVDKETLRKTIDSKPLKEKLGNLSAAMSLQGQGDFTFFEGYKTVPCGIVAMDFKDVIYLKDIGMVVRGARFYPAKMK